MPAAIVAGRAGPDATRATGDVACVLALLLCCLTPSGVVRAQEIRLQHLPPPSVVAWQPVAIEAVLTGAISPEHVATADIMVASADGEFRAVPLTRSRMVFFGEIPGTLVQPPELSYYLRLVDDEGTVVTWPAGSPEGAALSVPVAWSDRISEDGERSVAAWTGGGVEILSPLPGEVVASGTPEIAALVDPPLDEPWEAMVILDGQDVGGAADVTADLFYFACAESLSSGAHRVTFSALTATRRVEASWVFFVGERKSGDREPDDWPMGSTDWRLVGEVTPGFEVHGRLELGWATVVAETTAMETLDVFLPYEETNRPTIDFYASGFDVSRSFLLTLHYDPIYDDRLQWSFNGDSGRFLVDAGDIFPSLSRTTLDWAPGLGGHVAARFGRSRTDVIGMRMSEADTLAGFGFYSRFALGARQRFDWSDDAGASLVYLYIFDREGSIPEYQQLEDPLRNSVVAGIVHAGRGPRVAEFEMAQSWAEGEYEGEGVAVRASVGYERDFENRVLLECVWTDASFYSAGSLEYEPGTRGLDMEFAYRPTDVVKTSGWLGVFRTLDSGQGIDPDAYAIKLYGRVDLSWATAGRDVRTYVVARHDRTPYESHDYLYSYGTVGGSYRQGRLKASVSGSWSRSRSPDFRDTWGARGDLQYELLARKWTARVSSRWTIGTSEDRGSDYTRSTQTVETKWVQGSVDFKVEYWLVGRDDRGSPEQGYTEHVVRVSAGRTF